MSDDDDARSRSASPHQRPGILGVAAGNVSFVLLKTALFDFISSILPLVTPVLLLRCPSRAGFVQLYCGRTPSQSAISPPRKWQYRSKKTPPSLIPSYRPNDDISVTLCYYPLGSSNRFLPTIGSAIDRRTIGASYIGCRTHSASNQISQKSSVAQLASAFGCYFSHEKTDNRKVGGSSPPGGDILLLSLLFLM